MQLCEAEISRCQASGLEKGYWGIGTVSWEDWARIQAWSDLEAQVEYEYAEWKHKDYR